MPDLRQYVCRKCGHVGPAAFDGQCEGCGADLDGGPAQTSERYENVREQGMKCRKPDCASVLNEDQKFCTECGTPSQAIHETVTCDLCSLVLTESEGVSNCPRCGTSLTESVGGVLDLTEGDDSSREQEQGDPDRDGRRQADSTGGKSEVKCPACGATCRASGPSESEEVPFCQDCGYVLRVHEDEDIEEVETLLSIMAQINENHTGKAARDFANLLVWGSAPFGASVNESSEELLNWTPEWLTESQKPIWEKVIRTLKPTNYGQAVAAFSHALTESSTQYKFSKGLVERQA